VVDLVVEPAKHRIYNYGTQIVVRDLPTPSGNLQYWRKIRALATSYSASTSGVSRSVSWYGKARCGETMRRGIVAVDPRVIPLGTMIYVEGYGVGLACDTGSAVIGKRIDLGYGDNDLEHWYRYVDVYVLTPVPLNPRYRLE
jgi:3D (Asp-Asp-Asp) domain-containing protein